MRTTLTLEPDVATRLERVRRERDMSFKAIVNEALRQGLDRMDRPRPGRTTYRTEPWDLGPCRLPDLDDVGSALAWAEGDSHR